MHAGEASKASGQRAKGGKFLPGTVETTMSAEKRDEKCTPAESRRPVRRRNGIKNARRRGEESQRAKGGKFLAAIVKTIMPAEK